MEEKRERVLNALHALIEKRDRAKAVYCSAKEAFARAQRESASAVSVQHYGTLMEQAYDLWTSAEKDLDDFVLSDW